MSVVPLVRKFGSKLKSHSAKPRSIRLGADFEFHVRSASYSMFVFYPIWVILMRKGVLTEQAIVGILP
jgi:hypothetical protein